MCSVEDSSVKLVTSTTNAELRKIKKPLIEKRRRDRMNKCLDELKALVVKAYPEEGVRSVKMEKADILEKTVSYLKLLHEKVANSRCDNPHYNAEKMNDVGNNELSRQNDVNYNIKMPVNICKDEVVKLISEDVDALSRVGDLEDSMESLKSNETNDAAVYTQQPQQQQSNNQHQHQYQNQFKQLKHLLQPHHKFQQQQHQQQNQQNQQNQQQQQNQNQQQNQQQMIIEDSSFDRGFNKCLDCIHSYFETVETHREAPLRSSLTNFLKLCAIKSETKLKMEQHKLRYIDNYKVVSEHLNLPVKYANKTLEKLTSNDGDGKFVWNTQQSQQENTVHISIATTHLQRVSNNDKHKLDNNLNIYNNHNQVLCDSKYENLKNVENKLKTSRKSFFNDRSFKSEVDNEVPLKILKSENLENTQTCLLLHSQDENNLNLLKSDQSSNINSASKITSTLNKHQINTNDISLYLKNNLNNLEAELPEDQHELESLIRQGHTENIFPAYDIGSNYHIHSNPWDGCKADVITSTLPRNKTDSFWRPWKQPIS